VELTKELNRILRIEMGLSIMFHLQTDRQIKQINQELEQYLRFFTEYRQRDWPEWLVMVEFAVNNKVYSATKVSFFVENYGRELRMGVNIGRKEKVEKATEFAEKIRKAQEEAGVTLRKAQRKTSR